MLGNQNKTWYTILCATFYCFEGEKFMRIVLVALSIALFLILFLPVYFVLWIVGKFNPHAKVAASQKIVGKAFQFVLFCAGTKRTTLGRENVPTDQAVLYVGNHRSLADIPLTYITVPTLTGFVAKKEIEKVPLFSWWMRNLNCLFLDRNDMKAGLKTIMTGIEHIKNGYSMFIMPEGTRNRGKELELLPFKEGSFKMAEKTGCPIIPVAFSGASAIFEDQAPWVKKTHVIVHYGTPIYPNDLTKEERKHLGVLVRDTITQMLIEDRKLLIH